MNLAFMNNCRVSLSFNHSGSNLGTVAVTVNIIKQHMYTVMLRVSWKEADIPADVEYSVATTPRGRVLGR